MFSLCVSHEVVSQTCAYIILVLCKEGIEIVILCSSSMIKYTINAVDVDDEGVGDGCGGDDGGSISIVWEV